MNIIKPVDFLSYYIQLKPKFEKLFGENSSKFEEEKTYLISMLTKDSSLFNCAKNNPIDLQNAISYIITSKLSLNPVLGHCYLITYSGQIKLEISYKGMIQLMTTECNLVSCYSELVYSNDKYKPNGIYELPTHDREPFGDRGELQGAYCVFEFKNGRYRKEEMTLKMLLEAKSISKSKNSTAYSKFSDQMYKKIVIRRLAKQVLAESGASLEITNILNEDNKNFNSNSNSKNEFEEFEDFEVIDA